MHNRVRITSCLCCCSCGVSPALTQLYRRPRGRGVAVAPRRRSLSPSLDARACAWDGALLKQVRCPRRSRSGCDAVASTHQVCARVSTFALSARIRTFPASAQPNAGRDPPTSRVTCDALALMRGECGESPHAAPTLSLETSVHCVFYPHSRGDRPYCSWGGVPRGVSAGDCCRPRKRWPLLRPRQVGKGNKLGSTAMLFRRYHPRWCLRPLPSKTWGERVA